MLSKYELKLLNKMRKFVIKTYFDSKKSWNSRYEAFADLDFIDKLFLINDWGEVVGLNIDYLETFNDGRRR